MGQAMTTNYDPITEQYKRSKQQPWRSHIEGFSLMALIGDPTGKSVLDLACGEGFYTRMVRQRGAAKVTGVDLSAGMIDLARKQEEAHQPGIEYLVGDARHLELPEKYDLVVAAYLLNYAHNPAELETMCCGIAHCLKPGARFVTVNSNPALDFSRAPSYRKYGFETSVAGPLQEGAAINWTFHLEDGSFEIENYYLDLGIHEQALRSAGFREIRWHGPRLSPDGEVSHGMEFWKSFLDHPPITLLECVR
jgi:ubiquinone/menaquinone biosynthesis C-methylase UbiE